MDIKIMLDDHLVKEQALLLYFGQNMEISSLFVFGQNRP